MNLGKLSSIEFESACHALDNILSQPVESIELSDDLPTADNVTDSNKAFRGKLSILFVDMRKSTELTDSVKAKKMVKIYRCFIRIVIQAIRYSGGFTRQVVGDGVMAVFQDSTEDGQTILSPQKAVLAARYISTLVDYCLNPALKKYMPDVCIGYGIGICTGIVMVTKVGMRGKEADDKEENETGIVWVGSATNYASKYCSLSSPREIFIDESTFENIDEKEKWSKSTRTKGSSIFIGYSTTDYYLDFQDGFTAEAVMSEEQHNGEMIFIQQIFDDAQNRIMQLIDEVSKKAAELANALTKLKSREEAVLFRENSSSKENERLLQLKRQLETKEISVNAKEERNKKDEYELYKEVFMTVHGDREFAVGMGKDFWEASLQRLILCGSRIGKDEKEVRSEICFALVSLYQNLGDYNSAYSALCIQAETHPWIHATTVELILSKTYLRTQLKDVIEERLKTALLPDIRNSLQECLLKIK